MKHLQKTILPVLPNDQATTAQKFTIHLLNPVDFDSDFGCAIINPKRRVDSMKQLGN